MRCHDILCLLTWQETVFIYERKRNMLFMACSGYFSTTSRVEHHCCWKTWKYRAWRCGASFFAASGGTGVAMGPLVSAFTTLTRALLSFFSPPGSQCCFPSCSSFLTSLTSPITCVCRTDLRI